MFVDQSYCEFPCCLPVLGPANMSHACCLHKEPVRQVVHCLTLVFFLAGQSVSFFGHPVSLPALRSVRVALLVLEPQSPATRALQWLLAFTAFASQSCKLCFGVHSAVFASGESQVGGLQAVAASPEGAVNGYAIGSYLYLGIVFMLPMGLGLGGLALDLPVGVFTSTTKP